MSRAAVRVLVLTFCAAVVVFCVVQDRITAAGARRYVALQREALAGRSRAVTVEEVMTPAVRESVQEALVWSGAVGAVGLAGAILVARRHPRE